MLHRVLVQRPDPALGLGRSRLQTAAPVQAEQRWPVALALLALALLLGLLPDRVRFVPQWIVYLVGLIALVPIAAVAATKSSLWMRVERVAMLVAFVLTAAATVINLLNLVSVMIEHPKDISGVQLLSSSIGVWVTNVIMFSLLYWQIDRDGLVLADDHRRGRLARD